jgi:anti-sigma factor RsiW
MGRDEKLLMRYHDGELSPAEAREVEAWLRAEPERAAELHALSTMGAGLRARSEQAVAAQPFAEFFARVEDGVRTRRRLSAWERVVFRQREWLRPWAVWPAAAAAGVALLALVIIGLGAGQPPSNNCTIESLEYSGSAGAIFMIPDERGTGSTTVIWTNENDTDTTTEGAESP